MQPHLTRTRLTIGALLLILFTGLNIAQAADSATLNDDLDDLVAQGNDLLTSVNTTVLYPFTMASRLGDLADSVSVYNAQVIAVYQNLAETGGTISVTDDTLANLEALGTVSASLAQGVLALSAEVAVLAPATGLSSLENALYSMLQLSSDIGVMADRILEMAGLIMLMADNIGIMADRILATQVIQNGNLALVVDAMLQTQENTLLLFGLYL